MGTGLIAPNGYFVIPTLTATIVLGPSAGHGLSGSSLVATLGPGIGVTYAGTSALGNIYPLGILTVARPLATSARATTSQLEKFLLSQPGTPPYLAQELQLLVELLRALAEYMEEEDPELALLRPTVVVSEFAAMMDAADVVIPTPYPDLSGQMVLTMAMISGFPFTDRASIEAAGWEVDELVNRAADIYLEMIFRDGLYHADPHPGNFLLPDGDHMAILDFGDVGRLTSQSRSCSVLTSPACWPSASTRSGSQGS